MFHDLKRLVALCMAVVIFTSAVSVPAYAATSSAKTDLLTESQRRKLYSSKTNPAKGQKPVQQVRPAFNGYLYADFGTYNSYTSENNLGGTLIYLLGTIMDIVPFKEDGSNYDLALMVNDCDGYQWYMRANVAKNNLQAFKNAFIGKAEFIYGTYAGYSGVMNRPMMDAKITIDTLGNATDLSIYANSQVISSNTAEVVNANQESTQIVNNTLGNSTNTTQNATNESNSSSNVTNAQKYENGYDLSKSVETGKYKLNTTNGTLHYSTCGYGPDPENTAYFATLDDAMQAGNDIKSCGHCHPF